MGLMKGALISLLTAIAISTLPWVFRPPVPAEFVFGSCVEGFAEVEKVYRANFASGLERGSALSVYHRGERVCDLWGGWADEANGRPWQEDSLSMWMSTTKTVGALSVLMLVDRGLLDVKEPVVRYWPEFGKNGKERITVEEMLSHAGGLAALDSPITYDDILHHPDRVSRAFEEQTPNWPPGSRHGYHAFTIGLLMDQLVRRVDPKHRSLQQFFREEIAEPYDIDFYIGTPLSEHARAVEVSMGGLLDFVRCLYTNPIMAYIVYQYMAVDGLSAKSMKAVKPGLPGTESIILEQSFNWPESRVVPLPSSHGMGTARGLAKLLGMVTHGELFSQPSTLALFNHPVRTGIDELVFVNSTLGYGVAHFYPKGENVHLVGTNGHGGQMGFADSEYDMSYAYTTNYLLNLLMGYDERNESVRRAMYRSMERLNNKK